MLWALMFSGAKALAVFRVSLGSGPKADSWAGNPDCFWGRRAASGEVGAGSLVTNSNPSQAWRVWLVGDPGLAPGSRGDYSPHFT